MGDGLILSPGSTEIIPFGKTWMMGALWARLHSSEVQNVASVHKTAKPAMAAGRGKGKGSSLMSYSG